MFPLSSLTGRNILLLKTLQEILFFLHFSFGDPAPGTGLMIGCRIHMICILPALLHISIVKFPESFFPFSGGGAFLNMFPPHTGFNRISECTPEQVPDLPGKQFHIRGISRKTAESSPHVRAAAILNVMNDSIGSGRRTAG